MINASKAEISILMKEASELAAIFASTLKTLKSQLIS